MNLYQPHLMRIKEITDETLDTRTFRLEFKDQRLAKSLLQRRAIWRILGLRRG